MKLRDTERQGDIETEGGKGRVEGGRELGKKQGSEGTGKGLGEGRGEGGRAVGRVQGGREEGRKGKEEGRREGGRAGRKGGGGNLLPICLLKQYSTAHRTVMTRSTGMTTIRAICHVCRSGAGADLQSGRKTDEKPS